MSHAEAERSVKVALCGLTDLVRDVVSVLVEAGDRVEVIGPINPSGDVWSDFEACGADVLVCALPEAVMRERWDAGLRNHPPPVVLNLSDDCAQARLYTLRPHERTAEHPGVDDLLRLLEDRLPTGP